MSNKTRKQGCRYGKAVDRYIDKSQIIEEKDANTRQHKKQHISCPRCPEIKDRDPKIPHIGGATIRGNSLIVDHRFQGQWKTSIHISHSMITPEQKQKFRALVGLKQEPIQTQLLLTSKPEPEPKPKRGPGPGRPEGRN